MNASGSESWRRRWADRLRAHLWWLATGGFLLFAIWVVVGRQLLSMTPVWREDLEALIQQRVATPIEIGSLSGHMSGLSPVFVLDDVRLASADGSSDILTLGRVELMVDVLPSLLHRQLRARQLVIRGLDVRIVVDEHGRPRFAGGDLSDMEESAEALAVDQLLTLLYRQKRIQLEEVSASLQLPDQPLLRIVDIGVSMVSSGQRHRVALTARADNRPLSVDLRFDLQGDAYQRSQINGRGYARLVLDGAEPWMLAAWPFPLRPEAISGTLEGWTRIRGGQLSSASIRADLKDIVLGGDPLQQPWSLPRLRSEGALQRRGDGYQLALPFVDIDDGNRQWHLGALHFAADQLHRDAEWRVSLDALPLAPLTALMISLPWQPETDLSQISEHLLALSPSGDVDRVEIIGRSRAVQQVDARFADIALQASDSRPGVTGLSGWFSGSGDHGYGHIASDRLVLNLPALFLKPLAASLSGPFRWHDSDGVLQIDAGWWHVHNADAIGKALARVRWQEGEVPHLSLLAMIGDGRSEVAADYIPLLRLGEGAADWLSQAFAGGTLGSGVFLHEGPVVIDPLRQQDRTLQMAFAGEQLALRFLPDWPVISELSARVLIDGRHITGRNVSGQLLGSELRAGSVDIPGWQDGEAPLLTVEGQLTGPMNSLQQLFRDTPLAEALPDELGDWSAPEGAYQGRLALRWPLGSETSETPQVSANGTIQGASLINNTRRLRLDGVGSEFSFDLADGIQMPSLTGELFGAPIRGAVLTERGQTRLQWDGQVGLEPLAQWLDASLPADVSGDLVYQARLSLPWRQDGEIQLLVDSDMRSVVIGLPDPLNKPIGQAAPTSLLLTITDQGADISVRYQRWLALRARQQGGALQGVRVQLGGQSAPPPDMPGIHVQGRLGALNVGPWFDVVSAHTSAGEPLPKPSLNVVIGQLEAFGFTASDIRFTGADHDGGWRLRARSDDVDALLTLPAGYTLAGDRPLILSADKLVLRRDVTDGGPVLSPLSVPQMDVSIASIILNEVDYGRWQFRSRRHRQGVVIEDADAFWRGTGIAGRLEWTESRAGQQASYFVGSLESRNLGGSLRQWSLPEFIESDQAKVLLSVRWPDNPFALDPLALDGTVALEFGPGRFPRADTKTSALRVLGVFNMGSVSRRLRLDFTDLYRRGLSFDQLSGDFRINGSKLATNNVLIKSPSAEFRVRGEMDMESRTLDNYMEVTLPVSSNLYVGCLAGPAACAGIFVVDRLWGERLEKMTSLGYLVTGDWDNPKVEESPSMPGWRNER